MHDRSLIYIGLLVFLGVTTLPFTYNLAAGKTSQPPELTLPQNAKQCVEPVDYMRSSHMQLLVQWRDESVRRNIHVYKASDGKLYDIGLTATCLEQCHTNKAEFCDRCHNYEGVQEPYCMDCHIDPTKARGEQQ
jgi:hypothetical protein